MGSKVNLGKDVFTTFEVAKICNANITSIKNWIENGKISAFRTPGGHYRIERSVLIEFLTEYRMPNPFQPDEKSVVVVCDNPQTVESVKEKLNNMLVKSTQNPLEAALLIGDVKPDVVIMDVMMNGFDSMELVGYIRGNDGFKDMRIVAYGESSDGDLDASKLDSFVSESEGLEELSARIRRMLQ